MIKNNNIKKTIVGVDLVRYFSAQGIRIFDIKQARKAAVQVGLRQEYLVEALYHLHQDNWIIPLRRGLYALSSSVPGVSPLHDYEIAMSLVAPGAISHWSAFQYHGLTEQIPRHIFVLTPQRPPRQPSKDDYVIAGTTYQFIQTKKDHFFGIKQIWIGEARIWMTDLERTLLDGLIMPQYCGDFSEVLHAFETSREKINLETIINYALRLKTSTAKRLGWILEKIDFPQDKLEPLLHLSIKGYRTLNPIGAHLGPYNSRWMIQENLPGQIL